ncbi:MAG: hypothetical protein RBJ76_20200 [Stenomitos frigidus ULC029]
MACRGEVLIAVINNQADLAIAREQHWYRIPVAQTEKLKQQGYWSPKWLAFYQTKVFDTEAYCVNYYASVRQICEVYRWELFPDQPRDTKSEQRYSKLELSPLERLTEPIASSRLRRITFIPTTWNQFKAARAIEELVTHFSA